MTPAYLKPFWRYYGGKYRAAPRYPTPRHDTIVEPFAGAAGYSLRHFERKIVLVEKYAVLAEMWRYLIGASSAEVLRIPTLNMSMICRRGRRKVRAGSSASRCTRRAPRHAVSYQAVGRQCAHRGACLRVGVSRCALAWRRRSSTFATGA